MSRSAARTSTTRRRLSAALAVAACALIAHGAYLPAKACVGQALLARAWRDARADAGGHGGLPHNKPWPWADTWPVARLEVPAHDKALTVLAGARGESLAWGPGHVDGTPLPGMPGNAAIGGHRDTSFRFLKDVRLGELVVIERPDGERVQYRVSDVAVVDERDVRALAATPGRALTLVTCFPFDTPVPGGSQRYVVRAVEDVATTDGQS